MTATVVAVAARAWSLVLRVYLAASAELDARSAQTIAGLLSQLHRSLGRGRRTSGTGRSFRPTVAHRTLEFVVLLRPLFSRSA